MMAPSRAVSLLFLLVNGGSAAYYDVDDGKCRRHGESIDECKYQHMRSASAAVLNGVSVPGCDHHSDECALEKCRAVCDGTQMCYAWTYKYEDGHCMIHSTDWLDDCDSRVTNAHSARLVSGRKWGYPYLCGIRDPPPDPTPKPTPDPTSYPSGFPSKAPTQFPTARPSESPSLPPPTLRPSASPTASTRAPSRSPSRLPTQGPTALPSRSPTTSRPTRAPTRAPTLPTPAPTASPTVPPTPTSRPTRKPTPYVLLLQDTLRYDRSRHDGTPLADDRSG